MWYNEQGAQDKKKIRSIIDNTHLVFSITILIFILHKNKMSEKHTSTPPLFFFLSRLLSLTQTFLYHPLTLLHS
jgi:hypothetical protein